MANTTLTLSRSHAPLLVLALAAPLRLWNLGHSELQGDESEVVWRAFALVQGRPDAMVAHHKPPGELLMTAVFSAGLGGITELVGRLPFALAGVVACLAFYQLGRALFGARAGLAAGLLLAVNGYFVAFGRMLQYESVALLLDSLAVLCLYRFARGDGSRPAYAAAGGLLLAGSGLMALSGAFLLPVAALALGPCLAGPKRASRRVLAVWLWPLALIAPCFGLVALGLVRAPDQAGASSPADALREFIGFRFGGGQPYFNAERFLLSADHYLSSLYLLVVLGIGALALVEPLYDRLRAFGEPEYSEQAPRRVALAALAPEARNLAFASLFVGGLALLLGTARRSLGWKLALVWMAAPAFAHLFLVRLPYTHWRELFPGLLLLVAHAVGDGAMGRAGERARKATFPASPLRPIARSSARPLALVGALFLAATAHYVYTAWVRPWPEYQLTYPRDRHPLDWLGDDGAGAAGGTFGAARQHGWKVVGELATAGELPDKYATNARPSRPLWYLKRQPVCLEQAELYVLDGITARDRQAIEAGAGPPGFTLAGRVLVEDRPTIALFLRRPPPGQPREYRAEAYGRDFDRTMASPWVPVGDHYRPFDDVPPRC